MDQTINFHYIINAFIFSVVGITILAGSFILFDRVTPENLWKEIVLEKNIALAIFLGALCLAIAQIIASAIHG